MRDRLKQSSSIATGEYILTFRRTFLEKYKAGDKI